jgi:carboxylesterase type B
MCVFHHQRYNSNPWPRWMGTMHGDDIMFMFGEALKPGQNYSQDDRELSRMMMSYWTNFAKTGSV